MLNLSIVPDDRFITLDAFSKSPSYEKGKVILFDNDDAFITFCVASVAAPEMEDGKLVGFRGQYTEIYQKCLDAGMLFGIRTEDSFINRNKVANTRVLIPAEFNAARKDMNVQLPVCGIEQLVYGLNFICDGQVYGPKETMAKIVSQLVNGQGKTPEDVRKLMQQFFEVLSDEQFEALGEEEKNDYRSFSINRVKYRFKGLSQRKLLAFAVAGGVTIEDLVIR